jgi:hypothetical protein
MASHDPFRQHYWSLDMAIAWLMARTEDSVRRAGRPEVGSLAVWLAIHKGTYQTLADKRAKATYFKFPGNAADELRDVLRSGQLHAFRKLGRSKPIPVDASLWCGAQILHGDGRSVAQVCVGAQRLALGHWARHGFDGVESLTPKARTKSVWECAETITDIVLRKKAVVARWPRRVGPPIERNQKNRAALMAWNKLIKAGPPRATRAVLISDISAGTGCSRSAVEDLLKLALKHARQQQWPHYSSWMKGHKGGHGAKTGLSGRRRHVVRHVRGTTHQ